MRIEAVASLGATVAAFFTPDMTVAVIGVPVNVLFACAAGTYAAFGINKTKIKPRSEVWKRGVSCMVMGGMFTAVLKALVAFFTDGKLVPEPGALAAMGGIVSFITFFLLPVLADIITSKEWIDWIPWVNRNKG